jgi:hypothetical protein
LDEATQLRTAERPFLNRSAAPEYPRISGVLPRGARRGIGMIAGSRPEAGIEVWAKILVDVNDLLARDLVHRSLHAEAGAG